MPSAKICLRASSLWSFWPNDGGSPLDSIDPLQQFAAFDFSLSGNLVSKGGVALSLFAEVFNLSFRLRELGS
jgi:hypothetical protein